MPGYIPSSLHTFKHPTIQLLHHSPHHWIQPNYGAPTQLTPIVDTSSPLPPEGIQRLKQIIDILLYCVRVVDLTLLVSLGTLVSSQSKGTVVTAKANLQILNYCATHPDAFIRYKSSAIVLYIHSDTSYLLYLQSHSRLV